MMMAYTSDLELFKQIVSDAQSIEEYRHRVVKYCFDYEKILLYFVDADGFLVKCYVGFDSISLFSGISPLANDLHDWVNNNFPRARYFEMINGGEY